MPGNETGNSRRHSLAHGQPQHDSTDHQFPLTTGRSPEARQSHLAPDSACWVHPIAYLDFVARKWTGQRADTLPVIPAKGWLEIQTKYTSVLLHSVKVRIGNEDASVLFCDGEELLPAGGKDPAELTGLKRGGTVIRRSGFNGVNPFPGFRMTCYHHHRNPRHGRIQRLQQSDYLLGIWAENHLGGTASGLLNALIKRLATGW